jgi:hypothetical protein
MKLETLNEGNVLKYDPLFLSSVGSVQVLEIREYGLLCHNQQPEMCFSPDGIAVCSDEVLQSNYTLLIEIKTRTNVNTQREEAKLRDKYGKFTRVTVGSNDFFQCIPDPTHRGQPCVLVHYCSP